ncbi:MAG TPA: DUF4340 domain-containing protein [Candidatus Binatia bacterium]
MTPGRQSLVALAVIAASALATWIAWRMAPPPPPPPSAEVKAVFDFAPSAVRAIDVRSWQGAIVARRTNGHWEVLAVRNARADAEDAAGLTPPSQAEIDQTLDTLVREIVTLPEIDRFPLQAGALRDFGLEDPQATIVLQLESGEERTLQIGQLTTSTAALYARVLPSSDVLQVGTLVFNDIAAALYRLRALQETQVGGDA